MESVYELTFQHRGFVLVDFYFKRAEEFQKRLYELNKDSGLSSKEAFSAIYLSLIGKNHGPKAGWLILSVEKEFVKNRFSEVTS